MSLLSLVVSCLAGITFYVGIYHLFFFVQRREHRDHLAFALTCISLGFYDLFAAALYSSTSVTEGAVWQKGQFLTLAAAGSAMLWFISELVHRKRRHVDYLFYTFWALVTVSTIFDWHGMAWTHIPSVKSFTVLGLPITYYEIKSGILIDMQHIVGLLFCLYAFQSLTLFYRSGHKQATRPIMIGISILVLTAINDAMVASGIYNALYTLEYGYMCMMLGMAYSLAKTHLDTEKALRESESRYQALVDGVPDIIYTLDANAILLSINNSCTSMIGYNKSEIIGQSFLKFVHPEDVAMARDWFFSTITAGPSAKHGSVSFRLIHKYGGIRWVAMNGNVSSGEADDPSCMQGVIRDVTENRRAEENLARLAAAVNAAAESIIITDVTGKVLYVNPCFEKMTGYKREEITGKNPRILNSGKHDKAFYGHMWATLLSGDTWHGRFTNRKKDGTLFEEEAVISPVKDDSGKIVNYVAVKRDVTQQTALENQLRHSQTMEAVGRLSKGIAHDFTNMLVVITNSIHLAKKTVSPTPPELQRNFDNILAAANKAADLTGQLLAFSHQQATSPRDLDLNKSVRGIEEMLHRTISSNIELTIHTPATQAIVKIDPSQIEQIVVHLAVNACDAMPHGGHLTIETSTITLSPSEAYQLAGATHRRDPISGPLAVLTVSDSGTGMTPEVQSHIFEPFFTTKGTGRSTGLGLSTVYGIVRQHGGTASIYSMPGIGTTFSIFLPLLNLLNGKQEPIQDARRGTVLAVEDDPLARGVLTKILQANGHTVIEAENAKLGSSLANETKSKINLLICDIFPVGIEGKTFAENVKHSHKDIKVLYVSGYPAKHLEAMGELKPGEALISRPYAASVVGPAVNRMLAEG